jgi:hypothetical protein
MWNRSRGHISYDVYDFSTVAFDGGNSKIVGRLYGRTACLRCFFPFFSRYARTLIPKDITQICLSLDFIRCYLYYSSPLYDSHLCQLPEYVVFHTTYSGRTLGVKCQVCFTQHTQVAPWVWVWNARCVSPNILKSNLVCECEMPAHVQGWPVVRCGVVSLIPLIVHHMMISPWIVKACP